jgi:hypothetical protein
MRPRVNHLSFADSPAARSQQFASRFASSAQERPAGSVDDRWIPSLAIQSGVIFGRQHGTVSSDCRVPGTVDPTSCDPAPTRSTTAPCCAGRGRRRARGDALRGRQPLAAHARARPFGRAALFAGSSSRTSSASTATSRRSSARPGSASPRTPKRGEALDEGGADRRGQPHGVGDPGAHVRRERGLAFAFELLGRKYPREAAFATGCASRSRCAAGSSRASAHIRT